jgi:CRISPR-associated endoribonuclease Cas6
MRQFTLIFNPINGRIEGRHVTARGLHGLIFTILSQADAAEADWLHTHPSPKPFSLAPLYLQDGRLVGVRLAAFDARTADFFRRAWHDVRRRGEILRLGRYQTFTIDEIIEDPGASFALLASSPPALKMGLRFLSPTAFKQGPGSLPLPLPANVFSWPYRIWQEYAHQDLALPEDWLEWSQRELFVVAHRIETVQVAISREEKFTGFVGDVWFQAISRPKEPIPELYLCVWQALGSLATFSGVGHKTTMGMGAVERIE